ncbi:alpha/beta hydrolase [Kribbella sp. NPDC051137]|uniref:alpha/beta hydrolase n=1 Tax=Kribbella sp. NPDC051137 TaxID=3155045 RepID=UPI00342E2A38
MQAITFPNGPINMAGNLYLPADFDPNGSCAAIVTVHPGGGVKEQTAGLYAEKLAAQGFVALAYDASYQGESGGEPHFLEGPVARVEDVNAAVDHLQSLAYSTGWHRRMAPAADIGLTGVRGCRDLLPPHA